MGAAGIGAGCLPRLIGINCARLQSRTESLTRAASQHFFLIVLMITTRADDHRGVLIARRAALLLSPAGDKRGCPSPAPQGGLGCDGMSSRGPMQPRHCLSGCKTLTRGQEGHGGDSSLLLHPQALPHRMGGCRAGRTCPTRSPLCSRSVPTLAAALGHPAPTGAPNQLPQPRPQQVPQEGLGVLPWGARRATAKNPPNSRARH